MLAAGLNKKQDASQKKRCGRLGPAAGVQAHSLGKVHGDDENDQQNDVGNGIRIWLMIPMVHALGAVLPGGECSGVVERRAQTTSAIDGP